MFPISLGPRRHRGSDAAARRHRGRLRPLSRWRLSRHHRGHRRARGAQRHRRHRRAHRRLQPKDAACSLAASRSVREARFQIAGLCAGRARHSRGAAGRCRYRQFLFIERHRRRFPGDAFTRDSSSRRKAARAIASTSRCGRSELVRASLIAVLVLLAASTARAQTTIRRCIICSSGRASDSLAARRWATRTPICARAGPIPTGCLPRRPVQAGTIALDLHAAIRPHASLWTRGARAVRPS